MQRRGVRAEARVALATCYDFTASRSEVFPIRTSTITLVKS